MALLASLLPAVPETLSLRLRPFVPSFLPSPTPLSDSLHPFRVPVLARSPDQHTSIPRCLSAFGPEHSRPSLSSPSCSAFQFIPPFIAHYCIYYFCCPGDGNSSSGERRTHCWISLTFLPGSSGVGVGSWPGGGAGYFFAHAPTPQCQTFRVSVRLPSCIQSHGGGGCPQPFHRWGNRGLDCY